MKNMSVQSKHTANTHIKHFSKAYLTICLELQIITLQMPRINHAFYYLFYNRVGNWKLGQYFEI